MSASFLIIAFVTILVIFRLPDVRQRGGSLHTPVVVMLALNGGPVDDALIAVASGLHHSLRARCARHQKGGASSFYKSCFRGHHVALCGADRFEAGRRDLISLAKSGG